MSYHFKRQPPADAVEAAFHAASEAAVGECLNLPSRYHPLTWIGMAERWGAAEAARRLLVSGDIQTGFERLVNAGRPDLTVEWAVLDPKWRTLFDEQHREAARWRLRQAKIEPPH